MARPMRRLGAAGGVAAAAQLSAVAHGTVWVPGAVIGAMLLAAALGLFWWAAAATRSARLPLAFDPGIAPEVVERGPYAWVRHPFYTAYSLAWVGGALAGADWWAFAAPVALIPVYVLMASGEERRMSSGPLGHRYTAYKQRTGMFLPRLVPARLHSNETARTESRGASR